ncbi:MAG: hypothetical protein IJ170_05125 [Ruminococcus sp.]|nr:hypothetical protein [Ruminococcus sp.]MBQ8122677.1 hypothetical protein [Ruminococcus sp.]
MDNFAEQLVKKQQTSADRAKLIMIVAGGIILTLLLAIGAVLMLGRPLISFVGLIGAAGLGYWTYFSAQSMQVEYEYTFTNGELDIDKIIAKSRRKAMLSVDVSKFTAFGKYNDSLEETSDMTVVFATDNIASGEYYADFPHEEYGSTRLVFSPDEKMLSNIKKALPRTLRAQAEKEL